MTELEHEGEPVEPGTAPEEAPIEAPTPEPTPDDDDELAADEDAPVEPDQPDESAPEQEQPAPELTMTEKELEAGRKKIVAENTRHANRVSEIMGDEAQFLEPCPLCSPFVTGFIFPQVPPPEVVDKVRVAIGLPDLSNYQPAKHAQRCDDCAGLGVVLSGSAVPENAVISCPTCNASGFVVRGADGTAVPPAAAPNGTVEPVLHEGVNPNDPAVAELRGRGFTVIPPMQPVGAG